MGKKKRKAGEINSSSMADIAFLLLIFFLVTTSMSSSTGLSRILPPPLPKDQVVPPVDINKRNLFVVKVEQPEPIDGTRRINGYTRVYAKKRKSLSKTKLIKDNLPVRTLVDIPLIGLMEITKDSRYLASK